MNTLKALTLTILTACGGAPKPHVDLAAEVAICRQTNQGSIFTIIQQATNETEVRTEFCTKPKDPETTCRYIRDQIDIDPSNYFDLPKDCQARRP